MFVTKVSFCWWSIHICQYVRILLESVLEGPGLDPLDIKMHL